MVIGGMIKNRERGNMGFRIEDNCVGCPMGCINCGRRHQHVYYCDHCEDYTDELYEYEGQELCWDCYKESLIEKMCDDMDDEVCAECHKEADFLYQLNGDWYCSECLEHLAEKVERWR